MKVLLLGANGQLGYELAKQLPKVAQVLALYRSQCDLASDQFKDRLNLHVKEFNPDVLINAAAYTAVDKAEQEQTLAYQINSTAPSMMAQIASEYNIALIHYSTDYVFDGEGDQPWSEENPTKPQSVYGQTKCAGEELIRHNCAKHIIIRTSWVVGAHGNNFLKTMLRLASERDTLRVVSDQVGAPTSVELLAQITMQLLKHCTQKDTKQKDTKQKDINPNIWGTYHVAPSGYTNWHAYATHVIQLASKLGMPLKCTPENIVAISSSEYPLPAKRPLNSRLNTVKLEQLLGTPLPLWQTGVDDIIHSLVNRSKT